MFKKLLFLLITQLLLVGCANSKDFVLYRNNSALPLVIATTQHELRAATQFQQLFKIATGKNIEVKNNGTNIGDRKNIALVIDPDFNPDSFRIYIEENTLYIKAIDLNQLLTGISIFFSDYVGLTQFDTPKTFSNLTEIKVDQSLNYTSKYDFEYREPYFAQNFNPDFRHWNSTQSIEDKWALWGHNIAKAIKVTPQMLAKINGKTNDEQFDFSSKELEKALSDYISQKLENDPGVNHFMIMPNDNEIVCLCEVCKKEGNTENNASPAVFALLNRLADKFPKAVFFSSAYVTTQTPPKTKLKTNTGVMISTMSFPKGIILEKSPKIASINRIFDDWKAITDKIYLWDYAINFDNYFEFYPTLLIQQQNLIYYKSKGVNGVFMHGSDEGNFVAFGDLKAYIYAQLFKNVKTDIEKEIKLFFNKQYPKTGVILSNYYLNTEQTALKSNKAIDIYGGIQQFKNKYLNLIDLNNLFNNISTLYPSADVEEQKKLNLVLASVSFQELELLRTNGVSENGYAIPANNASVSINEQTTAALKSFKDFSAACNLKTYNEAGLSVIDYLKQWQNLLNQPYRNLLYGKSLKVLSKLDEDYPIIKMLNDGAFGFTDYYNNWLISTVEPLKVEMATQDVSEASWLEMHFLVDKKHRIYAPESVVLTLDGKSQEYKLKEEDFTSPTGIQKIRVPVKIPKTTQSVTLSVKKKPEFEKRAIACDEIIFN
ncbi:DUF4838 domain-containing protein [Pedobacter montanisoli]|uniref:DUF4838 domain-containing protein n=1 Tax=Pedobacter montanisoli TaxID=2923277 RepID=A0ABS9ZTH3_9SPHI|nr:DUF4838 domain-containing protein [Pedobacter montanisoli]MCJ0741813.1 DUF4838 domain-containing protein [Pedobacter montanisoli]